jgi:hypothetical protein
MNYDEFTFQLSKLGSAFGKSSKQIESLADIYYEKLSSIGMLRIQKIIDWFLSNNDRFPTIKEFLTVSAMFPKPRESKIFSSCNTCWGDGIVRTSKDGYRQIWKCCDCNNCSYNYPVWNSDFLFKGYEKESAPSWDYTDPMIIKGLAYLGEESIPWKKASQECREAATKYRDEKGNVKSCRGFTTFAQALTSKPDAEKERIRQRHIDWVEREEREAIKEF